MANTPRTQGAEADGRQDSRDIADRRRVVIVTRPEADAARLTKAIREIGLNPVASPLMRITATDATPLLDGVAALAFTSANGARAFETKSDRRDLPAFAVGRATADTLRMAGFRRVFVADGDVTSLAGLVAATYGQETGFGVVLHIAGTKRAGDLVAELRRKSIPAALAVLYDATPIRALSPAATAAIDAIEGDDPPCQVALFSPRTARLFAEALRAGGALESVERMIAVCLSDAVADAARASCAPHAWGGFILAKEPTAASLVDALQR